jgi:hypothetical protein
MEAILHEVDELSRQLRADCSESAAVNVAAGRVKAGRWLVEHSSPSEPFVAERDRFADVEGFPEIAAADLDVERLASGLQHHGGLHVRGFFNADQVSVLRGHLDTAIEFRANLDTMDPAAREDAFRQTAQLGMLSVAPKALADMIAIYDCNGFSQVVRAYLGDHPVLLTHRTKLKRNTTEGGIPWHQDAAFYFGTLNAVNVWSALTPAGENCPALEFVPRGMTEVVGFSRETLARLEEPPPVDYSTRLPAHVIGEILDQTPPAAPVLESGDALLFDEMTLHRTGLKPWTEPSRDVSITWFFAPSRFPRDGTPMAL